MGRYALKSDVRGKKFSYKYLPKDLPWEECEEGHDQFNDGISIKANTSLIYTSYFMQVGLCILFDHLLVDFLKRTRLHIAQLTPNPVRIILGIAEINRRFGIHLDFHDIRYCYGFNISQKDEMWNLKGIINYPPLVLG